MDNTEQDRRLRQKLRQKDIDFQQQLKEQMNKQQQNLKGYFKQFQRPIDRDPTKIKRSESAAVDRALVFKQALKPFTLFGAFYKFWNMKCATPEENYTLELCKKNYMNNMGKGLAFSLLITGLVSFRFRSVFTPSIHFVGLSTAIMSGLLYGAINSTKFTLEQFEKLGDGYQLGRIAITQIEKYRMDKALKESHSRR